MKINMQTPSGARRRFGMALALLARHWRRRLDEGLAQEGIFAGAALTSASWSPLVHLQQAGDGISQKDLAARVGIDGSSLVRLIDGLVQQGLVERRPAAKDRRIKEVHLTDLGRRAVKDVRVQLDRLEDELLLDLSEEEITTIMSAFTAIEHRLSGPVVPLAATED
jgi:MarR family transcriptional regulator for hemolysin